MAFNVPINLKEYHQDTSAKNHFKCKKKIATERGISDDKKLPELNRAKA